MGGTPRAGKGRHARRIAAARQYAIDATAWIVALGAAVLLRYDLQLDRVFASGMLVLWAAAAVVQFATGWAVHLYRGRHPRASFGEVLALVSSAALTAVILGLPVVLFGTQWSLPRSVVLIAAPIALLAMAAVRYVHRMTLERSRKPADGAEPALIYGAGELGALMVRGMRRDGESPYYPVGLIDDDPAKRNMRLDGIPVLGAMGELAVAAGATGATALVVAIGRADADLLRRISDAASDAGLPVKVLPLLRDVLAGRARPRDLRDLSIEDLVGRHPVDIRVAGIARYLQGKRVLVTGAGGSIGSELCRQISAFAPAELVMLDHDETGLQQAQISIDGHGLLDTQDVVLGDIRDEAGMARLFRNRRPDVVFHAAALKHLPVLEQYPEEAWKTNVLGTLNVLRAALATGVTTFVNISTDKAANPTSVLGESKRLAERLTAWAAGSTGHHYLSVRFGNVLGSRGSMLPTFSALIENGSPLTITHPDVTRYFMTIPEACQLVVQAGGIGRPGEVLVLDMGKPVRILDIAHRMVEMSGRDVPIVFTGLRPGEKLHEELLGDGERDDRPLHPAISHTRATPLDPERLDRSSFAVRPMLGVNHRAAESAQQEPSAEQAQHQHERVES